MTPDQFARYVAEAQQLSRAGKGGGDALYVNGHSVATREYEFNYGDTLDDDVEDYTEHALYLADGALRYEESYGNDTDGEVGRDVRARGLDAVFAWEGATGLRAWDALGLEVLLP